MPEKKRKDMPVGVDLMRSLVLYRAAQEIHATWQTRLPNLHMGSPCTHSLTCSRLSNAYLLHRMQKWESQAGSTSCMRPGARFYSLQHKMEGAQQQGNDYLVSLAEYRPPVKHDWRVLRLVGDGPQQDGVHRSAPLLLPFSVSLPVIIN